MDAQVTVLLQRWRDGDTRALDELTPLVYDQLRQIAARQLAGERQDHTLNATAVGHGGEIGQSCRVFVAAMAAAHARQPR